MPDSGMYAAVATDEYGQEGISIRAGISAQILASLVQDQALHKVQPNNPMAPEIYQGIARVAIGLADALIAELNAQ